MVRVICRGILIEKLHFQLGLESPVFQSNARVPESALITF